VLRLTYLLLAAQTLSAEQPGDVRAAISAQLRTLRAQPETAARLGAEARLFHFLAEASPDESSRTRLHAEGLALAARALQIDPREPSALLWWAAHRGSQARILDPFSAMAIAREVESALLRLREIDPEYEHRAADRVLGHLYRVAPRGISIGSLEKARTHLRSAIEHAPDFPGNALFYAQFLAETGQCDEARRWADRVGHSPELVSYPLERAGWMRDASRLLAGLSRRCPREEAWP